MTMVLDADGAGAVAAPLQRSRKSAWRDPPASNFPSDPL